MIGIVVTVLLFIASVSDQGLGFERFPSSGRLFSLKQLSATTADEYLKIIQENNTIPLQVSLNIFGLIKEQELEMKMKEIEKEKELETMTLKHMYVVNGLRKELLQSNEACTSRGVIEFILKGCQQELTPDIAAKGNFNARSVCNSITKCKLKLMKQNQIII